MDIIAIEGRTFEQIKQSFENFTQQIKSLCGDNRNNEKWLGNKTVCELLHISSRTLQSYRDNGTLPYSQIGRKCYYKTSDIETLISQSQSKKLIP
ncbi:helix-turn-helix domain-containing protein [Dysgonomonas sp. ZJ709]|uniref:helix-turn-helix domain-containing protein n=1 Tax=Dysgonomonas sp. ZJ709 TaxID=2709797 RepID=UPI0013EBA6CD|nr:helix-turn-helix domain-containing protein [Dysgonomonas sp. ZJ709]